MGRFGGLSKPAQALHAAECAVALCFAGMVLFIAVPRALADVAPIPQEAIGSTRPAARLSPALPSPTSQPRSMSRGVAASPEAGGPMPPVGHAVIVVTPLDLGQLGPQAYADWDQTGR